jgi:hypothetical protein
MPVRDLYHDAVKSALIKDDWIIIADPYKIQYEDINLYNADFDYLCLSCLGDTPNKRRICLVK